MGNSVDIHYTWVGPPDAGGQNRDVEGPIKLRRALATSGALSYKMYFWCLDAQVKAFEQKFAGRGVKDITVRGMESFLKTAEGTVYRLWYWYGARETRMVDRVKPIITAAAAPGASVRERVNAKNVWGFFTLYTWGGYHFDTGIEPHAARPTRLPVPTELHVPAANINAIGPTHIKRTGVVGLESACLALPGNSASYTYLASTAESGDSAEVPHIDVWALASRRYEERVARALHCYTSLWAKLEEIRLRERDSDNYKDACRSAIIDSLYMALLHDDRGTCLDEIPAVCRWDAGERIATGELPDLGLAKKYYGSHR